MGVDKVMTRVRDIENDVANLRCSVTKKINSIDADLWQMIEKLDKEINRLRSDFIVAMDDIEKLKSKATV